LITLLYQSDRAAIHSHDEHVALVEAIVNKDKRLAVQLMNAHLGSVIDGLDLKG
jgi:DNA-binding GntR family transcriptional regulator